MRGHGHGQSYDHFDLAAEALTMSSNFYCTVYDFPGGRHSRHGRVPGALQLELLPFKSHLQTLNLNLDTLFAKAPSNQAGLY